MPDFDPSLFGSYKQHIEGKSLRLREILSNFGYDAVLIASGDQRYSFRDDIGRPFRVNPYFSRLVPLTTVPDCFILIRQSSSKPQLFFNQPEDFWHKVQKLEPGGWSNFFAVSICENAPETVARELSGQTHLCFIGEPGSLPTGIDLPDSRINPDDLLNAIDYELGIKSGYEQSCMQRANNLAALGHVAARVAFFDGCSELGIYSEYVNAVGVKEGALPYGGIIAVNENASILHYNEQSDDRIDDAQRKSCLIDAGANYLGYAADVTRTYAYRDGRFGELIERMDIAHTAIIDAIRIGDSFLDAHLMAHREIGRILADFNLVTCNAEDAVASGVTRFFFPHGLGHFIGAQVHDRGGQLLAGGRLNPPPSEHPFLRLTRQIEEGQVFTVEPGLYFIPILLEKLRSSGLGNEIEWDNVTSFIPFGGIRIEDNLIVREGGIENMTRKAFAEIDTAF